MPLVSSLMSFALAATISAAADSARAMSPLQRHPSRLVRACRAIWIRWVVG